MVLGFCSSGAIILTVKNRLLHKSRSQRIFSANPQLFGDSRAPGIKLGLASTALLLVSGLVQAQELGVFGDSEAKDSAWSGPVNTAGVTSFEVAPTSVLNSAVPAFSISRQVGSSQVDGALVEDALNYQLGVSAQPAQGLNVSADAWRLSVNDAPANAGLSAALSAPQSGQNTAAQPLSIDDSVLSEFNIDSPLVGSSLETSGFDLSASYAWDTSRFGQFTLSTTSSYVQNFENRSALLELGSGELGALNSIDDRIVSPELQSSMMLSWQLGNHTASAITNYFDSFKDISEIDIDEINDLVDNITTFDLQYGYSVKTGSKDRAIISFGIRNLFDEKTAQILNSSTRLVDQNGRVAYGSIKYQF